MQNHSSSPFHQELYQALLENIKNKIDHEGLEDLTDIASFKQQLQSELQSHDFSLENIISNYHHFIGGKKTIALDKLLMDTFSKTQSPLKIYRGLPRIYNKQDPTFFKIKPEFSNLKNLKYLLSENLIAQEYEKKPIHEKTKITVITQVLSDGFGDIIAHQNTLEILRKNLPKTDISSILCIAKAFSTKYASYIQDSTVVYYQNNCSISDFPKEILQTLQKNSVIVTVATKLDCLEEFKKIIAAKPQPNTQFLSFGEYGFIESKDFGPNSGAYSMGLHFLEKGIFIPTIFQNYNFSKIENPKIRFQLFGTFTPNLLDINTYKKNTNLYFGYLSNPISGLIFLKTILEKEKSSPQNIDLLCPDLSWLIHLLEGDKKLKKQMFENLQEFVQVEIHFNGKIHIQSLHTGKKILRIICPGNLSFADFQALMFLSDPFIAVRGNLSISYAIAMNKIFFYDAPKHCKYFLKDLICLANNTPTKGNILSKYFHSMANISYQQNEENDPHWVSDNYFQQMPSWEVAAKDLSVYLQSMDLRQAFKVFNNRIKQEFDFSKVLIPFIKRAAAHSFSKTIQQFEQKQLQDFAQGHQTIQMAIKNLQDFLVNFTQPLSQPLQAKTRTKKNVKTENLDKKLQKTKKK